MMTELQRSPLLALHCLPGKGRILIVDDDNDVRGSLARMLEVAGYHCDEAPDAVTALTKLTPNVDLVLTDLRMPGMDGLSLLKRIMSEHPSIAVILISGYADVPDVVDSIRSGGYDYIHKPVDMDELVKRVNAAIARRRQSMMEQQYTHQLETIVGDQQKRLSLTIGELWQTYHETLEALSAALDLRDHETEGHSRRVTEYATLIARTLGVNGDALDMIRHGALLHDIGKIGIPDSILHKAGPLSPEEWGLMHQHPDIGYELLRGISFIGESVSTIVLHHHERFDGNGYPGRLAGKAIPLGARIFAIADTLDAITSDRVYRPARSLETARSEIAKMSGTQFDPQVVEAFQSIPDEGWLAIRNAVAILCSRI